MKTALKKLTKTSLFGWEDSYFGGYERVIYDHPFIFVPSNIGYDFTPNKSLSWYSADKLCKMFLLKLSKMGSLHRFLENGKLTEKQTFTGEKMVYYNINEKAQRICISDIASSHDEMSGLFRHYEYFLNSVEFFILIPPNDDDKKKGGGGKETPKEDDTTIEDLKLMRKLAKMLNDVEIQKPMWLKGEGSVSGSLKENTKFVLMNKTAKPHKFSANEVKLGNSLVSLLDISFEPKEDVIENLICGKMSPHKVAEIPAGNTHVYYKVEQDVSTRPFSLCVLGDESGSMRGGNQHRQHELFNVLYCAFSQILPPQKMFFYGHSGHDTPEVRVYHELYNPDYEYTIGRQLYNDYSENYDGPAIENIYERVRKQTSDNIIFISISDGAPAGVRYGGEKSIRDLKRVIEKCKRDGFVTMGVGLSYGQVKEIYNYHTIVNDMSTLVKNVSSLINRVVKTEFKD